MARIVQPLETSRTTLLSLPLEIRYLIWNELLVTPHLVKNNRSRRAHNSSIAAPIHQDGRLAYLLASSRSYAPLPFAPVYTTTIPPTGKPRNQQRALPTAIFRTSKQIHDETTEVFYTRNRFVWQDGSSTMADRAWLFILETEYPRAHKIVEFIHKRYVHLVRQVQVRYQHQVAVDANLMMIAILMSTFPNLRVFALEFRSGIWNQILGCLAHAPTWTDACNWFGHWLEGIIDSGQFNIPDALEAKLVVPRRFALVNGGRDVEEQEKALKNLLQVAKDMFREKPDGIPIGTGTHEHTQWRLKLEENRRTFESRKEPSAMQLILAIIGEA